MRFYKFELNDVREEVSKLFDHSGSNSKSPY
jgi:hypothetical protein